MVDHVKSKCYYM